LESVKAAHESFNMNELGLEREGEGHSLEGEKAKSPGGFA
jgi:hypothetical protein